MNEKKARQDVQSQLATEEGERGSDTQNHVECENSEKDSITAQEFPGKIVVSLNWL